jgi:hypothetical protein
MPDDTTTITSGRDPEALVTSEPRQLVPCHLSERKEAVGKLLEIREMETFVLAVFSWGSISLPLDLATELREQVGKKVAILHLDGYHMRVIDSERSEYRPNAEAVV